MTLVAERAHELASDIGEVSAVGWHGPAGMEYKLGDLLPAHKGYALQAKAKAIYKQLPMCCVYVVRDGWRIIYVGSTNYKATTRLKQHRAHGSPLGRLMRIDSNSPSWTVDIHPAPDRTSAYALETEMIHQLQPEVN